MSAGLPVSLFISVAVSLSPLGAQFANFNSCLVVGDSDVIDTKQRIRSYANLSGVAGDFLTTSGEYQALALAFAQVPAPTQLYVGRWAQGATKGRLLGGSLSATQQALSNFTGITNGGFHTAVDGGASTNVTGINLTAVTNLNGVAGAIQTALQALGGGFAAVTCTWNAPQAQFLIKSGTTGTGSSVSVTTAPTAGTDLGPLILTTAATDSYTVQGIAAESAISAVTLLDGLTTPWYALMFAAGNTNNDIADADHLAIAAYIEGAAKPHIYGLTTSEAAALTGTDSTSIGYQLKQLGYNRSFYEFSSSNPFAIMSEIAKMMTVNWASQNSTITLMYQQQPGVVAEVLTTSQAAALDANNYNYYAAVNNNTNATRNGTVASGNYVDTVWGIDWLSNQIQTNVYNLLLTAGTKVPQTDAGMNQIATQIEAACAAGVNNGLVAPGTWTSGGFGQISQGSFLSKGYYTYQPPISTQSAAARAARQSVAFQVAIKLAGATHSVSISVLVNN
jgi:Protein of unknown function (DUF3383)